MGAERTASWRSRGSTSAAGCRHALASLLLLACASCFKLDDDDCELRPEGCDRAADHSQSAQITEVERLYRLFEDAGRQRCAQSLRDRCHAQMVACASDDACKLAVACEMTSDPLSYQSCLTQVMEADASTGSYAKPWKPKAQSWSDLEALCLEQPWSACRPNQEEWDWGCVGTYQTPANSDPSTAVIAVLDYPHFNPVPGARVRVCYPTWCDPEAEDVTNDDGIVALPLERDSLGFRLEITSDAGAFPPTIYYPGTLSSQAVQPVAAFVVKGWVIALGNAKLGWDAKVLEDRGQSLILPDGCHVRMSPSVSNVTLHASVEGRLLARCDGSAGACVWHGGRRDHLPDPAEHQTNGWGAGVVGPDAGVGDLPLTVNICSQDEQRLFAQRTILLRAGWMTIARTWPLTGEEAQRDGLCPGADAGSE